ncbi:hypothetical protein ASC97_05845 [Rhizobium sp. Root1203]|uniref:DNA translocase FtsK n=1 Tax=Rhizobium sp. Root1203 TaxID=1736427 RepID=UPI000708D1A6|nr:DNA translocase FtsK [Rhizobium sp. Root1203]KQV27884.1 hypothetical protein ASC97_05845 [Rhizobium sp. Root1203]
MSEEEENYRRAVELVRKEEFAMTSMIQRRLGIGYNQAARHIERMEREFIVGPADHRGRRIVGRDPLGHMKPETVSITKTSAVGQSERIGGSFSVLPDIGGTLNLIMRLLNDGTLSEGQVAKATGLHRLAIRRMADNVRNGETYDR